MTPQETLDEIKREFEKLSQPSWSGDTWEKLDEGETIDSDFVSEVDWDKVKEFLTESMVRFAKACVPEEAKAKKLIGNNFIRITLSKIQEWKACPSCRSAMLKNIEGAEGKV